MAETVFLPVAEAYDRWSLQYDAQDNPMVAAAARILPVVAGDVAGCRAVEIGCGTGRNLAALKAAGAADLVGVDLSPGMLARAAARDAGFRLLQGAVGEAPPLPAASADLVLFSLVLEHVGELRPAFRDAARLLVPAGRVIVIEIHPWLAADGVAAHFRDAGGEVRMPTYRHRFSDYITAAVEAGLAVTACAEWAPADLGDGLTERARKRGEHHPLALSMVFGNARR
jgi:malonyl-CoA O-methyltransferase